jgi:L-cysteine desulfidase
MPYTVKDILIMEVAPALGCTEPVAIALGAAAARALLPDKTIGSIEVSVDPNIYKNGLAVTIPGTEGLVGLETAAAVGALGGDPALKLEVLGPIDDEAVAQARKLIKSGKVKIKLLPERKGLYIKTRIRNGENTAESVIRDLHDNVVSLKINGQNVKDSLNSKICWNWLITLTVTI